MKSHGCYLFFNLLPSGEENKLFSRSDAKENLQKALGFPYVLCDVRVDLERSLERPHNDSCKDNSDLYSVIVAS